LFATINGQYLPKISLYPGELRRLRMINAGSTDIVELSISNCEMFVVATDSIYTTTPKLRDIVIISPGSRVDILVRCSESSDPAEVLRPIFSKRNAKYSSYMGEDTETFEGILGFIHVSGASEEIPIPTTLPARPSWEDLRILDVSKASQVLPFKFEFSMDMTTVEMKDGFPYKRFTINDKLLDGVPLRNVKLGQIEEWVIVNEKITLFNESTPTTKNHPFHLHTYPFQIISVSGGDGIDYSVGDWRDTITVPTPGQVTIRFKPLEHTGIILAHCHMLGHADMGMVAVLKVDP